MTVSSLTNRNDYVGNGSVSVYSYSFRIILNSHLKVTVKNLAGAETTLTLTTDYTVTGVGALSGGTIVLVNAGQSWLTGGNLTTGFELTVRRVLPLKQETDIRNQGDFYPEVHEDQFDQQLMISQQQQDEINRSLKFQETSSSSGFFVPEPVASAFLGFNSSATALVALTPASAGSTAVDIVSDQTVDGQKTFIDKIVATPDTAEAGLEINQAQAAVGIDLNKTAGTGSAFDLDFTAGSGDGVDINHIVNGDALKITKGAGTGNAINVSDNFTVSNNGVVTHDLESVLGHISTPSTPAAGFVKVYPKSDNILYALNPAGVEAALAFQSYVTGLLDVLTQYAHVIHGSAGNTLLSRDTDGIEFNLSNLTEVDVNNILTVANDGDRTNFTPTVTGLMSMTITASMTSAGNALGVYVDGVQRAYGNNASDAGEESTVTLANYPCTSSNVFSFRTTSNTVENGGSLVRVSVTFTRRSYA
jgi:hypothetical protein